MTAPATATTAAFRSAVAAPAQPIAIYPHSTPHAAPRSRHSPKDNPASSPVTSSAGAESDADWLLLTLRELERIAGRRQPACALPPAGAEWRPLATHEQGALPMEVIAWYDEESDTFHRGAPVDGQRISFANVPGEQARTNAANLNAAKADAEPEPGRRW